MKKFISILLSAALFACPMVSVSALETDLSSSGKTGGVLVEQGAQQESVLAESATEDLALPQYYSSVDMGYVTSVKNQGSYNTCIFFSGIAAMETALLKNGYGEYDLSEEHANYWASTRNDGTGWLRDRKNDGAYPYTASGCLTNGGVVAEQQLPYMSCNEEYFEDIEHIEPLFYASGIKKLSGGNVTSEEFKQTIMETGGVTASFAMLNKYLNSSTNAYCCTDKLSTSSLSSGAHSVFAVGWDDNYSKLNFNAAYRPENDGAWLIKNSWGDNTSYFWISYEDMYFSADIFGGCYAITDVIKNHSCNELLSVDEYGTIYDMDFSDEAGYGITSAVFINTFEFGAAMPSISDIEFSTPNIGADYKVYYIPTVSGIPVSDKSLWTELAQGTVEYSGVQDIKINRYAAPSGQGAIGVSITASSGSAAIGCCEWLTGSGSYLFKPRTLDNRSYVYSGGDIMSLTDYYSENGDQIGGNFTIKAVVNVLRGDANKDGNITVADAVEMQKHISNIITLDSDTVQYVSDVNSDGKITVADAVMIQKHIANIISLQ